MGKQGNLVVEGAKFYCSNSVDHNAPGTASVLKVTSQTKKLGKNKYFASDKPIGTYLDDKAESFDNGQGFGKCLTPNGQQMPCAGKCKITYSDYYENVEFNSSMKILLDISTGKCPGYGKPGDIKISDCGQAQKTSTIKVNEKDEFQVSVISPQWPIADKTTKTGVKKIKVTLPIVGNAGETFLYLDKKSSGSLFDAFLNMPETKMTLEAEYTGDESKIVWGLFKGTDVKDKVRTYIGIGKGINLDIDKLFTGLTEGKYRIEAYGSKPGDNKCAIFIDYIKNYVEKITTPGDSVLKNIPMPFTLKYKITNNLLPGQKILNSNIIISPPSASWKITQGDQILYNSAANADTGLVKVMMSGNIATITFKNAGKYTVSATTSSAGTPFKKEITVAEKIGVKNVEHGNGLIRYSDNINAKVKDFNVAYVGGTAQNIQWYLKKEGKGRIRVFEESAVSKISVINKRANDFLYQDAKILDGSYFGNYVLEAYGSALAADKNPEFKEAGAYMDCYNFEVARNSVDSLVFPEVIPTGTKVKYEAKTRMALVPNEKVVINTGSTDVTDNGDGTLTFPKEGEYTIKFHLEGNDCDTKEISKVIKVATPELKKALWSYQSGYKRTETGYKEDSFAFVEIAGMGKQQMIGKVWIKGLDDSFYSDPEKKFMLEEKPFSLNEEGKGSFKITTTDAYKTKIEAAIPPTAANPTPKYELIFTVEVAPSTGGNVTLPAAMEIKNARAVQIGDKTLYEVLEANEVLGITSEKKIKSIVFSDEAGKDIQRAQTFYGKTHKIWVHTVNMQDDELLVNVYKEIPGEAMAVKNDTVSALTSKKSYPAEKVGTDSMLKLDFTPDKEWNKPEEKNVDFYFAWVSKKGKDAEGKDIFIPVKGQVTLKSTESSVSLITTQDLESVGIKAKKEDGTPFTQEEMISLRKQYLLYENGCLKVSNTTTQEAIENDISPVAVEMAEIKNKKDCYCNKPMTEEMLKNIVKTVTGRTTIWTGCELDDESWTGLVAELNTAFGKYNINTCMQKISFFAQVYGETDLFVATKEGLSSHASSQSTYKGRGLIQLTGERATGATLYEVPGPYKRYANYVGNQDIITSPDLISDKLHYTVDSAGWMWSIDKKCPNWSPTDEREAMKWKSEYFKKALGQSLNGIANYIEEEDKYFYLQAKILNGYSKEHKLEKDPHGWDKRQKAFRILKNDVFEYDIRCKGGGDENSNLAGAAPWLKVAWEELNTHKGKTEVDSPLKERVAEYFALSGSPTLNHTDAWCATFIFWCFQHTKDYKDTNVKGNVGAYDWGEENNSKVAGNASKDGWPNGEITEAFVGAIIVFTFSHVAIIVGETKDGTGYVYLGGNQGSNVTGGQKICLGSVAKTSSSIFRIMKPKTYKPSDDEKKLPKYDVNAENSSSSSR
ncbi:hypothetical protein [Flavobacterium sp. '19STA2R22 D10 B1']|uniref:hypothetical protein n=1 Tax=Flavobacterium aerium TaxID=3037261 RepID=UPI00278C2FE2|nr:hypothetical protein [Flavobacterium sp. '19STA2R22 D10 B1']